MFLYEIVLYNVLVHCILYGLTLHMWKIQEKYKIQEHKGNLHLWPEYDSCSCPAIYDAFIFLK